MTPSAQLASEVPRARGAAIPFARRPRRGEMAVVFLIHAVALLSIGSVLAILVFLVKESLPVLYSTAVRAEVAPLFGPRADGDAFVWQPVGNVPKYSVLPLFLGSLKVTAVAMAIAAPLGIAAAVYVSELAGRRTRQVIKPVIELLAGIPSVVIGFFALVVLSGWVHAVFGTAHRLNAVVAGLGLAFAICPVVFSISEDALRAVPMSYRHAAVALGSTRTQALLRVVMPAAAPGIAASLVLGFGRGIGETMIVVLASGNAALLDLDLGHSTRTVTATIAQELGEVVVGSPHYHVLFALGALLFLATCAVNLIGEGVIHRMRASLGGTR